MQAILNKIFGLSRADVKFHLALDRLDPQFPQREFKRLVEAMPVDIFAASPTKYARRERLAAKDLSQVDRAMFIIGDDLHWWGMANSNSPLGFTDDPNYRFAYNSPQAAEIAKRANEGFRRLEAFVEGYRPKPAKLAA